MMLPSKICQSLQEILTNIRVYGQSPSCPVSPLIRASPFHIRLLVASFLSPIPGAGRPFVPFREPRSTMTSFTGRL